ncbi:MAG: trypsin-like peptidase domain-containing protein [Gammaproteobacteria bacterium]
MRTIEILEPSVKSLFLTMRYNGQELSTGTGFLLRTANCHVLVTNRHNVTGRNNDTGELLSSQGAVPNEVVISHNFKGQLGSWIDHVESLYVDDKPLWHEHPVLGSKADFIALPITITENVEFRVYDLDDKTPLQYPRPSDIVSVVGFPFGIGINGRMAIWATGFVASETGLDSPAFLIDSRTRPGQSGSAVIAQRNGGALSGKDGATVIVAGTVTQFLGIYSGRINSESDIGIVWKASAIKELIEAIKKTN